jgi:serine/threonine-protein kinase
MNEVFQVQSDVAEEVIQQLNIALLGREREAVENRPTENLEAYQAFLQGLHLEKGAGAGLAAGAQRTAQMFEKAVHLDPNFALAYTKLSIAHSRLYWFAHDLSEERLTMAKNAAHRALELQPDLPDAHVALGWYFYWGYLNYDHALEEFTLAEKDLPNNSEILMGIGSIQYRRGNWKVAQDSLEKALELDPLNVFLLQNATLWYIHQRRHEEADRYAKLAITLAPDQSNLYSNKSWNEWLWKDLEVSRRTLEEMPETDEQFGVYTWFLQEVYERNYLKALERLSSSSVDVFEYHFWFYPRALLAGRAHDLLEESDKARVFYEEARLFLEKELQERPDDARVHSSLGIVYAGLGRRQDAIREAERGVDLLPVSKDAGLGPFRVQDMALTYTMVGEHEAAFDQIELLLSIPANFSVKLLELDPAWDPLREHRRYREIIEKYR